MLFSLVSIAQSIAPIHAGQTIRRMKSQSSTAHTRCKEYIVRTYACVIFGVSISEASRLSDFTNVRGEKPND